MAGLNAFLKAQTAGEKLTPETLDEVLSELWEQEAENAARTIITDEEWERLQERGAMWVGNRIIFTTEARDRCKAALDSGDFSILTAQEVAMLNIMARQAEQEES